MKQKPELKRLADLLSLFRAFAGAGMVILSVVVPRRVIAARALAIGFVVGYFTDLIDGDLARRSGMPASPTLDGTCDLALLFGFIIGTEQIDTRRRTIPATLALAAGIVVSEIPHFSPRIERRMEQLRVISYCVVRLACLARLSLASGMSKRATALSITGSVAALAIWRRERLKEYL